MNAHEVKSVLVESRLDTLLLFLPVTAQYHIIMKTMVKQEQHAEDQTL